MRDFIVNQRDYKECLKDFINGFGSDLGTPEMLNTENETYWIETLLYTIPAYVDMFLKGNREYGYLETLITSKKIFTLRCVVGYVEVLIEYNLEGRGSVYGCTFRNRLSDSKLFMQMINGEFYCDLKIGDDEKNSRAVQLKFYDIFD